MAIRYFRSKSYPHRIHGADARQRSLLQSLHRSSRTPVKPEPISPRAFRHNLLGRFVTGFFLCAICFSAFLPLSSRQRPSSLLIVNAQLADGTGSPLRKANVRMAYDRIVEIGDLTPERN